MRFTLRPYQNQALDLFRDSFRAGNKRPILCLPTGAGKTVTFSQIAEAATAKGNDVLVVCHRKELIQQAHDTMKAYGVNLGRVHFGMVQTFVRSPHKIPKCKVCIIDECHSGSFRRFLDLLPESVTVVGATATPMSASKKMPLNETFDDVVSPVSIPELIDAGYLAKPLHLQAAVDLKGLKVGSDGEFTARSLEETYSGLFSNIEDAYQRRKGKTIIFCSSVAITEKVAAMLGATYVHSKMSDNERDRVVADFKATPGATIVNCGILTAGFDDPEIETVIVFRATTSLTLWLQMCGRGSRVIPGRKDSFTIIDMGGNINRHDLWHSERDWKAIFLQPAAPSTEKEAIFKVCVNSECECMIYASANTCEYCGTEQPKKPKPEKKAMSFIEIAYETGIIPTELIRPTTAQQLIDRMAIGNVKTKKPYSVNWAMHQIKRLPKNERLGVLRDFCTKKGYKSGFFWRKKAEIGA